jgi:hypothetical protein
MVDGLIVVLSGSGGGVAEIHFWSEQDIWTNLELEPTSSGKLEEP